MQRLKNTFYLFFVLVMLCGLFGCAEKSVDTNQDYVYLPKTKLQTYNNGYGDRFYKYEYKYDSYGNIIKEEYFEKRSWRYVRETCTDTTYTYDGTKIATKHVREEEFATSITDGSYVHENNYKYIYDEKGLLIKKEDVDRTAHYGCFYGERFEYDSNGNCIKKIKCFDGAEETDYEYRYDDDGRLIKEIEVFDDVNLTMDYNQSETEYTYDDNGTLICSKKTYYTIDFDERYHDGWDIVVSHYVDTVYHYDEMGRLIKEESVLTQDGEAVTHNTIEYKDFTKIAK